MAEHLTKRETGKRLVEEHELLNRLMDELREETAVVPRAGLGPWIEKVRDRFAHFEAHLVKHMALEEQGGYLAPVLECRPVLAHEVARLKQEHSELQRLMYSIRLQAQGLGPGDRLLTRDLCRRIERLMAYIDDHEHEEDMLLIDAVSRDIGVKD